MSQPKVLVVFYSRTGNTRKVGADIARALSCDTEEIRERHSRLGIRGYLRCGYEAWFARPVPIREPEHDPGAYDLVVVGTPIWNASLSSPVRAYMTQNKAKLPAVAFFITYGGSSRQRVLRQMQDVCGRAPVATLALRERDLARREPAVAEFVATLRRSIAATQAA
jgi:flavodoxin